MQTVPPIGAIAMIVQISDLLAVMTLLIVLMYAYPWGLVR